jgi:hypothetical protein
MVAGTVSYFYYYTAAPAVADNGTLVAIAYSDAGFRYRPDGNFVDRGDLKYSNLNGDWWEYDFTKGVRLTHKSGFDGVGVDIYVSGVKQNATPVYLATGVVYFEIHPNTATVKTVRVVIADQSSQSFHLQTGLDIWQ